jgi:hypothetical protein
VSFGPPCSDYVQSRVYEQLMMVNPRCLAGLHHTCNNYPFKHTVSWLYLDHAARRSRCASKYAHKVAPQYLHGMCASATIFSVYDLSHL